MKTKLLGTLLGMIGGVILGGTYLIYSMGFDTQVSRANPDYICIKDVSRSCEIDFSTCTPWNTNGERTCYGKRVTKVAYYNLRTTCEKGYGNGINVTTANDQVHYSKADSTHVLGKLVGNALGKGGRHSADFVYATESCSIKQYDTKPPVGKTSVDHN